jgi:sigma-B regulation protein RsbU (phosphoserine phosphatase)
VRLDALEEFYAALLDDDAEKLYERAPCGYLSTTPDGLIIKVNQTFLTLTGYRREDLVGRRTFAELLSAGGRIYHETHYAPMLRLQGNARGIALDIVTADRRRLPALVNSVLERSGDGEPVVVRTAIFDATERREYERELLRAKERAEASEARATALARTLQQTLIPPALPHIAGLDVAAAYRPAGGGDEVGGDFYDVFEVGTGDWVVTIGDVCGKGAGAAVVTATARHTLRAVAVGLPEPSRALATLNDALNRHRTERFCTVAYLRLRHGADAGTWTATVSCGGHPPPLLIRPGRRPATFGRPGSLLGVLAAPALHDTEIALRPGDALLLYTDGVTEGRRGEDFYDRERLAGSAADHAGSAQALVDGVLADALAFQAGVARDDIALVAVHVPG